MNKYKTNLALMMDILDVSTPQLMNAVGVDKTQVSRWRSGARKLMAGGNHTDKVADVFIEKDSPGQNEIRRILSGIYSLGYDSKKNVRDNLIAWLSLPDQNEPEKTKKRTKFFYSYMARKVDEESLSDNDGNAISDSSEKPTFTGNAIKASTDSNFSGKVTSGYYESRSVLSDIVDYLSDINEPSDIIFVCPEGIDIITSEEEFSMDILSRMTRMLRKGYKLNVVLRTDFKMSEVASFAGPWLVAHLSGYIKSWYYDDFRKIETDKILVWVNGKLGVRISGDEYKCEIFTDSKNIEKIGRKCKEYKKNSVQRFYYNYFEDPADYLADTTPAKDGDMYLYQRLPSVSIGGSQYFDEIGLKADEQEIISNQFVPFAISPGEYSGHVYCMLCIEDIEEALDKPKHMNFVMQEILGRRVYVDTQTLVNQLVRLKKMNKEHKNFHLCFMKNDVFERIVMEIGVWEWRCAIGWIRGIQSTATNDNFNTLTLHGFCATVWGKIPALFKSNAAANRHLNKLIGRAKKFGYDVK